MQAVSTTVQPRFSAIWPAESPGPENRKQISRTLGVGSAERKPAMFSAITYPPELNPRDVCDNSMMPTMVRLLSKSAWRVCHAAA